MRLRIINDIHIRGADEFLSFKELSDAVVNSPYLTVLNGDIFDFANCKYKELPLLKQEADLLLHALHKKNGYFIRGNHEANAFEERDSLILNNIYLAHGDLLSWDIKRSIKFRNQKLGGGWFKRNLISRPLSKLRHLVEVRPNKRLKANLEGILKIHDEVEYVVLGHSHPSENVYFNIGRASCVILKQGVNDIEVSDGKIKPIL